MKDTAKKLRRAVAAFFNKITNLFSYFSFLSCHFSARHFYLKNKAVYNNSVKKGSEKDKWNKTTMKQENTPVGNCKRCTVHGVTCPSVTCPGGMRVPQYWLGVSLSLPDTPILGYPPRKGPETSHWGTLEKGPGTTHWVTPWEGTSDQSLGLR